GPDKTIIQGNTETFDAGSCSGCTYQWSNLTLGQPNIGTGLTYTTGVAGVYMVSVTSPNGCVGRDTVQLNVIPVNPVICTGYEFWFAAPAVTNHTIPPSPVSLTGLNGPISMYFTTDEGPVTVTVDQPANPLFTPITCTVNNDSAKVVILTPFMEMIENKPADSLLTYGLRVTSDKRISATYEIQSPYNAATYSLYGKDALGQSFIIPAQHNYSNYPYCSPPARNSFDLVATEDSTIVTIIPAKDLTGHAVNVPFSFMMNRGQTWSGRAISGDAVMHLGGTTVTSTRPIAITVTDDALFLPGYDDLAFDVAGDQLIPLALAGKEFIALAMSIPAVKTLLLCYAKEDNTTVIFNDSISIKTLTVNQGECAQFAFDNITNSSDFRVASIRSDKPVSVYEFTGNENEFMQPYHSFQASASIIPPVECHGSKKATISSTPPGVPWHNWLVYAVAKRENGDGFICDPPNFITNVGTPVPGTNGVWGYSMHGMSNSDYYYRVKITNTKGRFFIPAYSSAVTSTGQFSKYAYFTDFTALNLGVDRKMCPGDCILLDAGIGWTSYLWSTGDTTSTIMASSAGTYWVSTSETGCQLSDTIVISYYPITPVNLGPDRSICLGDSTLLNAGNGRAWYLWSTGANTQSIWAKDAGSYWVKVPDVHCDVSDTVQVSTTPLPVVTNPPPLVKTICTGESTNMPLTGNVPGILFHWSGILISGSISGFSADSGLIINQILTNNGATAGVVMYHIIPKIVDCEGVPVNYTVNVNVGNPVDVTIAASGNSICAGTQVTFTATPTNPGTNPTYLWKINGVNSGSNAPTFAYVPTNGDIVTCILTSSNIVCTSNNPATSNTITMVVNPLQPVSVSVSPSANPVCVGSTVTFTANPTHGGTLPMYQWKINTLNVSGATNPTYTYVPLNGDIVTCQLTSSDNCVTGNPAISPPVTMTVNQNLEVTVTITASSNPFCSGSPVTYTATAMHGGSTPVFQWNVNGSNAGTNSPTFSYSPANGDQVSCLLNSSASCITGNPALSNIITMTVNTNLPAGVLISTPTNPFCPGTAVIFTAVPINGGPGPSYQWKINGVNAGTNST
ncbi:MAG: PKD-like domain-containing protein, partial [Bacteroidota bacterium]